MRKTIVTVTACAFMTSAFAVNPASSEAETMSTGKKIGTLLRTLKYVSAPLFRSEAGLERMAAKPKFDKWLDDLKLLTDVASGTSYEDETQFEHAINLLEERIKNDQFALSGYHGSLRTNRREARKERKLFKEVTKQSAFNQVFEKYQADKKDYETRSLGPVFAHQLSYSDDLTIGHIDGIKSLDQLLDRKMNANKVKCEELCPEDHRILRVNRDRLKIDLADKDTHLNFTNFRNIPEDFDNYVKKQFGFCWGHSSSLYKFKHYARFNPEAKLDSLEEIKTKLEKLIREQEIVTFNGIASIRELTDAQGEETKHHFMREIAREWARNAMTIKNILALGPATKELKYKDYIEAYNEVVKRVLSNQIVQIKFNAHDINGWSHIVNAYGFEETPEEYRIYVQDPNVFPEDVTVTEKYPNGDSFLAIKKKKLKGKTGFAYSPALANVEKLAGSQRIGLIEVTNEGRLQVLQTIQKYAQICREQTECQSN